MTTEIQRALAKPVRRLEQYFAALDRIALAWAPNREFYPWFRGHGNTNWELLPSLYRPGTWELVEEDDFRREFKLRAWPFLEGTAHPPAGEWEWYFLMQHCGLPTRLLDWSESALVALYFALRDSQPDADAAVWLLDPWMLNLKAGRRRDIVFVAGERGISGYIREPFSSRTLPRAPVALQAPLTSRRIAAQRGVFTIHGSSRKPLNKYAVLRRYLAKIEIARKDIPIMKEQLAIAGTTESTLFPELSAVCRELNEYWRYKAL